MALITFSTPPSKGASSTVTLDKTELVSLAPISGNSYWSDASNISKVNVVYKSTTGNQRKTIKFDFTQVSPQSTISFTSSARDNFQISLISLVDFDKDKLVVPASEVNLSAYNISLI